MAGVDGTLAILAQIAPTWFQVLLWRDQRDNELARVPCIVPEGHVRRTGVGARLGRNIPSAVVVFLGVRRVRAAEDETQTAASGNGTRTPREIVEIVGFHLPEHDPL